MYENKHKEFLTECLETPKMGTFDVIVAGGGVAGAAAALAARRDGRSVLLIEKSINIGGLATIGLINYFVPMCNGRGRKIIRGMCEEFIEIASRYGYDTLHPAWKDGDPGPDVKAPRFSDRYSPSFFAMALARQLVDEGVEVLLDTIIVAVPSEEGSIMGVVVENKSGRRFYAGSIVIDATGDADVSYLAGAPTVQGKNYYTYITHATDLDHCADAVKTGRIDRACYWLSGGNASLFGDRQPDNVPLYGGTTAEDVTEYVLSNQALLLDKMADGDRFSRNIVTLPSMPQFRTTRHLDGDYTLLEEDVYRHFDDSIAAICDFEHKDALYEVSYRCLVRTGWHNLLAVGRAASGDGYGWDVLRVIPPAILTGQAAGNAASMALSSDCPVTDVDIAQLQKRLADQNVLIHFEDEWIPADAGARSTLPGGK